MTADPNNLAPQQQTPAAKMPANDDFFSDAPLVSCPLRKDGTGADEVCESCQ